MVSFLTTLKFALSFYWVTAKHILILIISSWILYFININDEIINFLLINLFVLNIILIYSLFKKDKLLKLNGFYCLFNISEIKIFFSKSLIFGIPLIIHFSTILLFKFKIESQLYLTIISIILLFFLTKLIFVDEHLRLLRIFYFTFFSFTILLSYILSGLFLMLIIFWILISYFIFLVIKLSREERG
jgi:hypothetical protein